MTTDQLFACDPEQIKGVLFEQIGRAVDWLFVAADSRATTRQLEVGTWSAVLVVGATLLGAMLAVRCRRSMLDDLNQRGLSPRDVVMRHEADYHASLTTTLGGVRFPLFAYRDRCWVKGQTVTRTPARREVLPLLERCQSSELLVEWEAKLGSEMPFRQAQQALTFFTHGAVKLEDTTIARHTVAAGMVIDAMWQYRRVQHIREALRDRATRDKDSGRPIVYASTDAHALRRYVGETWETSWKMANGVRLWCEDKDSGHVIHLGGEYTWGDCVEVEALFLGLQRSGVLPASGDYGDGVHAQIVIVTDGSSWIKDRIVPLFPGAIAILDAWHLMERLAKEAHALFGQGTKDAREWYDEAVTAIFGLRPERTKTKKGEKRRGRPKRQPGAPRPTRPTAPPGHDSAEALATLVFDTWPSREDQARVDGYDTFLDFFTENMDRMAYANLRERGFRIGSGAMESLHRIASQARLKLPGARWLEQSSKSLFGLRMLGLVDRWAEFWDQLDLPARLAASLAAMNDAAAAAA